MGKKIEVPINGSVLAWAMDEAGIDVESLARRTRVDPDIVRAWISGDEKPGKTEFGKIIDAVRRPSAIFFMLAPPITASLPTSFRSAPGLRDHKLSTEALREIRKARRLQRVISWLAEGAGREPVAVDLPPVDWETTKPGEAGEQLRQRFSLPLIEQATWPNMSKALGEWRLLLDELGVLTFSLQLGKTEVRGFSAWDDYAPLIAVNTAYVDAARIYTLAHELAHLVTRTDAACFDWVAPNRRSDPAVERWCERFASAFLLPRSELRGYLAYSHSISADRPVRDFDTTWKLSRKLKVSARAMALALSDAGLAPDDLYDLVDREANKVDWPPKRDGGGGMRVVPKRLSQYGARVTRSLVDAVDDGTLQRRDVADYLDMNLGDLQDLGDAIHGKPMTPVA